MVIEHQDPNQGVVSLYPILSILSVFGPLSKIWAFDTLLWRILHLAMEAFGEFC